MSFNSINKATILGRLGRDPEIRMMQNGKKVASFSVATNTSWIDKQGEKKELTDWHNIVVFNEPTVKFIESYIKKGSRVYIEGTLKTRKWVDKAGHEKYTTEVIISGFEGRCILLDNNSEEHKDTTNSHNIQKKDDYDDFFNSKETTEDSNKTSMSFDDDDLIPF